MTHIAYYYQPKAPITRDGHRPRITVLCDENGVVTYPPMKKQVESAGWVLISHHEPGKAPLDVWDKAKI